MKGPVDAFTGLTLSNRVSLGQLWWRDPDVNTEGEDAIVHILMELLGPIPTTGVQIGAAGSALASGDLEHVDRGIEKMTPKALRDIMRAYRFSTEGALTQHIPQDVLVSKEEFGGVDLVWQAIGFTPARLTMQYEQNSALRRAEKAITDRRQRVINAYQFAAFNGDKAGLEEALEMVSKFNASNPSLAIGLDTLKGGATSRMTRSALSKGGVTLQNQLRYLYNDLSFTPEERLPASAGEEEE